MCKFCMGTRNDISFFEGGGEEAAIRQYQIDFLNKNLPLANRRFFPPLYPHRQCHSELIHQAQLHIPWGVRWINEESHALFNKNLNCLSQSKESLFLDGHPKYYISNQ